ncbi:LamG domain-containing protein [Candidatus Kaiserbacteria bacterium]|nr:LamG domain-containing protein [Candidatus Kaiserbacteria bacterium]
MKFDGVDDYVAVNNNLGIFGNAAFSVSAWFKWTDALCPTNFETIFGTTQINSTGQSLILTLGSTDCRPTLDFWNARWRATNPLQPNTWYHIVGVKIPGLISTTSKIYINGIEVPGAVETDMTPNIIDASPVIGRLGVVRYFNGSIDDVRIYNRALSASEVTQLYNSR